VASCAGEEVRPALVGQAGSAVWTTDEQVRPAPLGQAGSAVWTTDEQVRPAPLGQAGSVAGTTDARCRTGIGNRHTWASTGSPSSSSTARQPSW
jgi:hypothetical protein